MHATGDQEVGSDTTHFYVPKPRGEVHGRPSRTADRRRCRETSNHHGGNKRHHRVDEIGIKEGAKHRCPTFDQHTIGSTFRQESEQRSNVDSIVDHRERHDFRPSGT